MEHLYAVFLLSGIIKSFLNFYGLSLHIDFTLLTGLLLILWIIINHFRDRQYQISLRSITGMYLLGLFYLWMNISISYSLSTHYSYSKSVLFLTNILAYICPLLYKQFDIMKFSKSFIIISSALGVLFLSQYAPIIYSAVGPERAFSGLYLSLPEVSGICLLILLIIYKVFPLMLNWFLIILNSLIIILAGGRGPIIFVGIVLIIFAIFQFFAKHLLKTQGSMFRSSATKRIILLVVLLGFSLLLLTNYSSGAKALFDRSKGRLSLLLFADSQGISDISSMDRIDHILFSKDLILTDSYRFFLGYGLGSYGVLYGLGEGRAYPHNILLEIWVEMGLVGILIFSFFLINAYRKNIVYNPFLWFIFYLFLNALKSSSFVDIRLLFGFIAMFILYYEKVILPKTQGTRLVSDQF